MPKRTTPPALRGWPLAGMLLCLAPLVSLAADDNSFRPLRPVTDCIDPARVRSWSTDEHGSVLIDAGRHRYLVELDRACPQLDTRPLLGFISHNPSGRICGDAEDRVVAHGSADARVDCPIRRVHLLAPGDHAERTRAAAHGETGA